MLLFVVVAGFGGSEKQKQESMKLVSGIQLPRANDNAVLKKWFSAFYFINGANSRKISTAKNAHSIISKRGKTLVKAILEDLFQGNKAVCQSRTSFQNKSMFVRSASCEFHAFLGQMIRCSVYREGTGLF